VEATSVKKSGMIDIIIGMVLGVVVGVGNTLFFIQKMGKRYDAQQLKQDIKKAGIDMEVAIGKLPNGNKPLLGSEVDFGTIVRHTLAKMNTAQPDQVKKSLATEAFRAAQVAALADYVTAYESSVHSDLCVRRLLSDPKERGLGGQRSAHEMTFAHDMVSHEHAFKTLEDGLAKIAASENIPQVGNDMSSTEVNLLAVRAMLQQYTYSLVALGVSKKKLRMHGEYQAKLMQAMAIAADRLVATHRTTIEHLTNTKCHNNTIIINDQLLLGSGVDFGTLVHHTLGKINAAKPGQINKSLATEAFRVAQVAALADYVTGYESGMDLWVSPALAAVDPKERLQKSAHEMTFAHDVVTHEREALQILEDGLAQIAASDMSKHSESIVHAPEVLSRTRITPLPAVRAMLQQYTRSLAAVGVSKTEVDLHGKAQAEVMHAKATAAERLVSIHHTTARHGLEGLAARCLDAESGAAAPSPQLETVLSIETHDSVADKYTLQVPSPDPRTKDANRKRRPRPAPDDDSRGQDNLPGIPVIPIV
jgi:hypothetical protein